MPVYEYTALDRGGKNKRGIVDADSPVAARQKLRSSGIFPVDVKETSSRSGEKGTAQPSMGMVLRRVRLGEISAATRQLAILLGGGITLVSSLDAIVAQMANPVFKKALAQVKESVNEGNSLAFSLSKHPRIFSQIYVNMVRAGEESGSLDLVLDRLAELSERQQALRGRLRAAMAYPVFMFVVGSLVLFFLVTFVVPNITRIFDEMHQVLPLPTLMLMGVSHFLQSFWWLILIGLGCAMLILRRLIRTRRGRYVWDRWKLGVPVMGAINTKTAMARFARTLGSLLQNGVGLLPALGIVRNIVNNRLIAEAVDDAIEDVKSGNALSTSLSRNRWFPPIAVQMISAGETGGELENMLGRVADVYEGEVESQTLAITSMLEPVMILIMGLTVGFIVVSILLPIFDLNQMIR
ncbi:MAG: type II secretion system inner membrane protein GspF [Deltaproteobacteria bacterium]|nr:type II secretion system inner membrane protein GspF [Deltaproteobacteria bacterium]MCF8118588.1 type II secretion system inner membrane protein GspF [Deltaproteobacteria bacterium]